MLCGSSSLQLAFIDVMPEEAFSGKWDQIDTKTLSSHQCLKEIEFAGFVGHQTDYELALHLLEIAVSLEKISVDTRHHPGYKWGPDVFSDAFAHREAEDQEAGKELAQQFRSKLATGVDLVIV